MNNVDVQKILDDCATDLGQVRVLYAAAGGPTSNVAVYLTRYALVRACGAIEVAYKAVVADYCSNNSKVQVRRYLTLMVRERARNPLYVNMYKLLAEFDEAWSQTFKAKVQARGDKDSVLARVQSLVDARNEFAHGGSPTVSLGDVIDYFASARHLVEEMDATVV